MEFVSVTSPLRLTTEVGVPCDALLRGTCGVGTRAGRQSLNPPLLSGLCHLEAGGPLAQAVRSLQKKRPSVRVCV